MCIIIGQETKCHELCSNCSENSYCGNQYACTSCFPGDYKIAPNFSDTIFQCSKYCNGDPIQHGEYYYCDEHVEILTSDYPVLTTAQTSTLKLFHGFLTILLIIAVSIFLYFVFKVYINKKYKKDSNVNILTDAEMQPLNFFKPPLMQQTFEKLDMITNIGDFEKGEEIGGGAFSLVFKGTLRGMPVAIKIARDEGRKSIHKELQIYDKVKHPNILPALGVHLGVDNMLFLALRNFNLKDYFIDYGKDLNFHQLKQYSVQVADGMKYLHNKNILHCDLKIENILVKDEKGEFIEISDFGCAIDLDHDHSNKFIGTQTHTAYELLKNRMNPHVFGTASKASDVWSFAVTMWQIFQKSDQLPIDFIKSEDIIKNYEAGKKLPKPGTVSEDFWRYIILPCFDLYPKARPCMEDLHKSISRFHVDSTINS